MIFVVPTGAFDAEFGLVSSIKGWAEAYGMDIDKMKSKIIKNFFINSSDHDS